ncbi:EEP domain-containing protein, partial [Serratia marcescens]
LGPIGEQIASHRGPVIMAGDFNAWSRKRINALYDFAGEMALREVSFTDDHRRKAFGRPLDFVFYRNLGVVEASVLVTSASDHNPLLVEFHPEKDSPVW